MQLPIIEQWSLKDNIEIETDDFWYDLTDGGYLKPEDILDNSEEIIILKAAISIVKSFQDLIDELMEEQQCTEK